MQRVLVQSTTLASAGHDARAAVLELQFRNGAVYQYFHVSRRVYRDLLGAPSKGAYFNHTFEADIPTGGFNTLPLSPVPNDLCQPDSVPTKYSLSPRPSCSVTPNSLTALIFNPQPSGTV